MGADGGRRSSQSRQLLDTQLLLWLAITPTCLPTAVRSDLSDRRRPFLFSVASLWEVAIKTSLGKPGFQVDAGQLRAGLRQQGLEEVAITADHCLAVQQMRWIHRDPFDRLLVAQAIHAELTLLTADPSLSRYGSQVVWVGHTGSGG